MNIPSPVRYSLLVLGAAVGLTTAVHTVRATDIFDTLFVQIAAGQKLAFGSVPGLISTPGVWVTTNPSNGAIMSANLLFGSNVTTVRAASDTGVIALNAGPSDRAIMTARWSSGAKVGVGKDPAFPMDVKGRLRSEGLNAFETAGLWLADPGGTNSQFMGTKVHSTDGATQELGMFLNNAWSFTFRGDGQAFKPGGGSWASTSDARVKKDINRFTVGLKALEQVRPVRFRYNGLGETKDDGKSYVGVIAQELEAVAPYMVSEVRVKLHSTDEKTTAIRQVDPSALTYMLINAVQELSAQNRRLKASVCAIQPHADVCRPEPRDADRMAVTQTVPPSPPQGY